MNEKMLKAVNGERKGKSAYQELKDNYESAIKVIQFYADRENIYLTKDKDPMIFEQKRDLGIAASYGTYARLFLNYIDQKPKT